jgi:hypothetical protein
VCCCVKATALLLKKCNQQYNKFLNTPRAIMRYSKQNIINFHLEFCRQRGIKVSQNQRNAWSEMPGKTLRSMLAQDQLEIARGWSQYAKITFN